MTVKMTAKNNQHYQTLLWALSVSYVTHINIKARSNKKNLIIIVLATI